MDSTERVIACFWLTRGMLVFSPGLGRHAQQGERMLLSGFSTPLLSDCPKDSQYKLLQPKSIRVLVKGSIWFDLFIIFHWNVWHTHWEHRHCNEPVNQGKFCMDSSLLSIVYLGLQQVPNAGSVRNVRSYFMSQDKDSAVRSLRPSSLWTGRKKREYH